MCAFHFVKAFWLASRAKPAFLGGALSLGEVAWDLLQLTYCNRVDGRGSRCECKCQDAADEVGGSHFDQNLFDFYLIIVIQNLNKRAFR